MCYVEVWWRFQCFGKDFTKSNNCCLSTWKLKWEQADLKQNKLPTSSKRHIPWTSKERLLLIAALGWGRIGCISQRPATRKMIGNHEENAEKQCIFLFCHFFWFRLRNISFLLLSWIFGNMILCFTTDLSNSFSRDNSQKTPMKFDEEQGLWILQRELPVSYYNNQC